MSEELKPCPFCGGTNAEPEADRLLGMKWGRVVCRSCFACGEGVRTDYDTVVGDEWHTEAIAKARAMLAATKGAK